MTRYNDEESCDIRGMLGFLILFLLYERTMHGQEIADELAKRRGVQEQFIMLLKVLKMQDICTKKKK